eukprot:2162306-Pyramimonas_sp.AAC.1
MGTASTPAPANYSHHERRELFSLTQCETYYQPYCWGCNHWDCYSSRVWYEIPSSNRVRWPAEGQRITIRWHTSNFGYSESVKIKLFDEDSTSFDDECLTVTSRTANDGSFTWTIPMGVHDRCNDWGSFTDFIFEVSRTD